MDRSRQTPNALRAKGIEKEEKNPFAKYVKNFPTFAALLGHLQGTSCMLLGFGILDSKCRPLIPINKSFLSIWSSYNSRVIKHSYYYPFEATEYPHFDSLRILSTRCFSCSQANSLATATLLSPYSIE
jgi:hypothetical protein